MTVAPATSIRAWLICGGGASLCTASNSTFASWLSFIDCFICSQSELPSPVSKSKSNSLAAPLCSSVVNASWSSLKRSAEPPGASGWCTFAWVRYALFNVAWSNVRSLSGFYYWLSKVECVFFVWTRGNSSFWLLNGKITSFERQSYQSE